MAWQPTQSPGAAPGTWVPDVFLNTTVSLNTERCTNSICPYCEGTASYLVNSNQQGNTSFQI